MEDCCQGVSTTCLWHGRFFTGVGLSGCYPLESFFVPYPARRLFLSCRLMVASCFQPARDLMPGGLAFTEAMFTRGGVRAADREGNNQDDSAADWGGSSGSLLWLSFTGMRLRY